MQVGTDLLVGRVHGGGEVTIDVENGDMFVGKVSSDTAINLIAAHDILDSFDDANLAIVNATTGDVTAPTTGDIYLQAGNDMVKPQTILILLY